MDDIVLVTGEAVRYDYLDHLGFLSSFPTIRGIAAGHFTRPSLAGLHSCSYIGAIQTKPQSPTLAEVLNEAGYTCIGYTTNPQVYTGFNFGAGFTEYENFVSPGTRGSKLREFLARFQIVQRIYQRIYPIHERRAERPSDREVVDMAIESFNSRDSPRFLWVHLMDSHRPYGLGSEGISPSLSRKAKFSPKRVTDAEQSEIESKYSQALEQVDDNFEYLLNGLDGDPLVAFAGDHGELLGETGAFFHPPHEKRAADEIVEVPIAFSEIEIQATTASLIDIGPTLVSAVGLDAPSTWQGLDLTRHAPTSALTIVPWQNSADVVWRNANSTIRMQDCRITYETDVDTGEQEELEAPKGVRDRLRDFGYIE